MTGAIFAAVSLPVLAPAYFGFLHELRGYTDRSGALSRDEAVNSGALDPRAISTFASPYLTIVGTWESKPPWHTDIAMCGMYLFPPLLVAAIVGPWMRLRDGFRWWLAGMGLLCLAVAVGGVLPLRGWLYDLLPPMRFFRHATMFRCFYVFTVVTMAILSGRDLQAAIAGGAGRWKRIAAVFLAMAVAALTAFIVVCAAAPLQAKSLPLASLAAVHLLLIWGGAAALAFFAGKAGKNISIADKNASIRRASFGRQMIWLCILDAMLTVVVCKPTMYANRARMWSAVEAAYVSSIDQTPRGLARVPSWAVGDSPRNGCLGPKVAVLKTFNVLRNALYEETMKQPVLAAGALGDDRIWFASKVAPAPLDRATAARLAARSKTLGSPCVVLSDPSAATGESALPEMDSLLRRCVSLESLPAAVRRPIQLRRYDDRHLEFDVVCPEDGWLLVTDRWAPSWRAWVNDVAQRVWIGNVAFRAVRVRQGENRVRFWYSPCGYPWLLAGSWLTLGLAAAGSAAVAIRRKRLRF